MYFTELVEGDDSISFLGVELTHKFHVCISLGLLTSSNCQTSCWIISLSNLVKSYVTDLVTVEMIISLSHTGISLFTPIAVSL